MCVLSPQASLTASRSVWEQLSCLVTAAAAFLSLLLSHPAEKIKNGTTCPEQLCQAEYQIYVNVFFTLLMQITLASFPDLKKTKVIYILGCFSFHFE